MSIVKRFPLGMNMKTFMAFFIALHFLIFANVFWEMFNWFNQLWADPSFSDPILFQYVFWTIESLVVMFVLGRKLQASHLG